jgi:hypothetical protein
MANVIIGNTANVIIDGSNSTDTWILNGLDANGKVLQEINVKIVAGATPVASIPIQLPAIASLNFRSVTININANDFAGAIALSKLTGTSNTLNGLATSINVGGGAGRVVPIISNSSSNWFIPALDLA